MANEIVLDDTMPPEARAALVAKLLHAAYLIQHDEDPRVLFAKLENLNHGMCQDGFVERIVLTMSHPWPG